MDWTFFLGCSQDETRAIFEELTSEFAFTVDQLLELSGAACALAITKVLSTLSGHRNLLMTATCDVINGASGKLRYLFILRSIERRVFRSRRELSCCVADLVAMAATASSAQDISKHL